jgi:hypothetical protein
MLTIPPLEKIISRSRSSKMRNTNAITNSSSSVTSIETRAYQDGIGLYHRSDCDYPRYKVYGRAGDWVGSKCGYWIPVDIPIGTLCGVYYPNLYADVVWYGDNDSVINTFNNIKNKNKDGGGQHNWTTDETMSIVDAMYAEAANGSLCT